MVKKFLLITILSLSKPLGPIGIDGPDYIEEKYYNVISENEFLKNFTIGGIVDTFEFRPSLNFHVLGEKEYILYAQNQSYYQEKVFILNIIDDKEPTIKGPEIIYINDLNFFDPHNILNFYSAYDDYDGYLDVHLSEFDVTKLKTQKRGNIKLYAEDSSKNIAYKNIEVCLNNNDYGVYFQKNSSIDLERGKKYKISDIVNILIENKIMENVSDSTFYIDLSKIDFNRSGKYNLTLKLLKETKDYTFDFTANVKDFFPQDLNLITKILMWIINLIKGKIL